MAKKVLALPIAFGLSIGVVAVPSSTVEIGNSGNTNLL